MLLMRQIHFSDHWKGQALGMDLPASKSFLPAPCKQQVRQQLYCGMQAIQNGNWRIHRYSSFYVLGESTFYIWGDVQLDWIDLRLIQGFFFGHPLLQYMFRILNFDLEILKWEQTSKPNYTKISWLLVLWRAAHLDIFLRIGWLIFIW